MNTTSVTDVFYICLQIATVNMDDFSFPVKIYLPPLDFFLGLRLSPGKIRSSHRKNFRTRSSCSLIEDTPLSQTFLFHEACRQEDKMDNEMIIYNLSANNLSTANYNPVSGHLF